VTANSSGEKICLALSGLKSATVPSTGESNQTTTSSSTLGETKLDAGSYDLQIVFKTGGVSLDWIFLKTWDTNCFVL
jgi:hypothetical protein